MRHHLRVLVVMFCMGLPLILPGAEDASRRIEGLAERLGRRVYSYPDPTPEQLWLHETTATILARTRLARDDEYRFDRLARATDSLLEASEAILEAREAEDRTSDEDDHMQAARDLERDYFRVQQAEYFAKRSGEVNAADYVKYARLLYQQARRAFDEKKYRTAESLGDAVSDVARALEYLEQAAIRVPEPPRLEP